MSSREINCSGKGSVVSFCTRKKKKKIGSLQLLDVQGFSLSPGNKEGTVRGVGSAMEHVFKSP